MQGNLWLLNPAQATPARLADNQESSVSPIPNPTTLYRMRMTTDTQQGQALNSLGRAVLGLSQKHSHTRPRCKTNVRTPATPCPRRQVPFPSACVLAHFGTLFHPRSPSTTLDLQAHTTSRSLSFHVQPQTQIDPHPSPPETRSAPPQGKLRGASFRQLSCHTV